MVKANFADLHRAGCLRTGFDLVPDLRLAAKRFGNAFAAFTRAGHGDICNGCPHIKGCAARRKLDPSAAPIAIERPDPHVPSNSPNYPGMSVRQIAEALGVSMNEVKRRKLAGTL